MFLFDFYFFVSALRLFMRKYPLAALSFALLLALVGAVPLDAKEQGTFVGLTNKVAENRGIMAVNDPATGHPYIAAFMLDSCEGTGRRCSLLLVDALTGKSEQFWYPDKKTNNGELFHLLRGSTGRLYTTMGTGQESAFVEFDVAKRQWSYSTPIHGMAMSFAEAKDGTIYFATYPHSRLYEYNPGTRVTREIARLDPEEKYPFSLAIGEDGWIYAGIGTARSNIVGVHRKTGEVRQLLPEAERLLESAEVALGADGKVYGRAARKLKDTQKNPWYSLEAGQLTQLAAASAPDLAPPANIHFFNTLEEFPKGGRIISCSVPERLALVEEADGKRRTLPLDYDSDGAINTAIALGADGMIYGNTNHPTWFFKYDPVRNEFSDLGTLRGGLLTNLAPWGDKIAGAAYPNGGLYLYDPALPWAPAEAGNKPAEPNPRLLTILQDIKRPRVSRLLRDGKTLVAGGFPGYGHVTGGIALYDLENNTLRTWSLKDLFPGQSAFVIRELPNSLLAVGTSTETPGGGQRVSKTATFFVFDPVALQVVRQLPIPEREVRALDILPDGTVLLLAAGEQSICYQIDAEKGVILKKHDVTERGVLLSGGYSLVRNPETGALYALLSHSISRIREDGEWTTLMTTEDEISSGSVILNNSLYYTVGARLMKYALPVQEQKAWKRPYPLSRLNKEVPPLLAGVHTPQEWAARRSEIMATWQAAIGEQPKRPAPSLRIISEKQMDDHLQQKVIYQTVYGDQVPALLLIPLGAKASQTRPAILALHPTNKLGKTSVATVEGVPNRMYGLELVRRGYIVLAPDALTSGERIAEGARMFDSSAFYQQHPGWSTVGKNLADHQQALDVLSQHPLVDRERIGVMGHSFGGYNAYFLSAMDERVKAVVSSCGVSPFSNTNDIQHWGRRPMPYTHFPLFTAQLKKGFVPFEFNEIMALTAPRPQFYYSGQADTIFQNWKAIGDCYSSVCGVYELLGHKEAFASFIGVGKHDFPPEVRKQAYEFLDYALQYTSKSGDAKEK